MASTSNEHIRKPLVIKEFRPIEKAFRRELAKELKKQVKASYTKELVQNVFDFNEQNNVVGKAEDSPEDLLLKDHIHRQVEQIEELEDDSTTSQALKAVLLLYILRTIKTGLVLDKIKTIEQLLRISDPRMQRLAASISIKIQNITHVATLDYLETYTGELVTGLNRTTKKRIKTILYNRIRGGDSVDVLAKKVKQLEQISTRRAYTIARTEIGEAKAYENRIYLQKRGYRFWQWGCNSPVDICLVNCGVVRQIGDPFPSGNISPLVHPNCQCFTDGYVPSSGYALELFIAAVLLGTDWMGD